MSLKNKSNFSKTSERTPYPSGFLNPQKIISHLKILPGMKIAHFGCGTGFFTFPIAEKIGKNGTIYALDILEQKVEVIKSQVKLTGFHNIIAKRVNLEKKEGSKIEKESIDWVIIVNMLYQNNNKSHIIREAKRILKKNGHILLIDWNHLSNNIGPEKRSRVSKEELIKIARKHLLGIQKEIAVGDFHFGLILTK